MADSTTVATYIEGLTHVSLVFIQLWKDFIPPKNKADFVASWKNTHIRSFFVVVFLFNF